jgi:hypothetical protein
MMNSNSTLSHPRNVNHSTLEAKSNLFSQLPSIKQNDNSYNTGGRISMMDSRRENESINEVDSALYPESQMMPLIDKSNDEYTFKPNIAQH